jgi:hypothetical protein
MVSGGGFRSGTIVHVPLNRGKDNFYRIKLDKDEDGEDEDEEEEIVAEVGNIYEAYMPFGIVCTLTNDNLDAGGLLKNRLTITIPLWDENDVPLFCEPRNGWKWYNPFDARHLLISQKHK